MPADWNPGTQFVQGFSAGSAATLQGFATGANIASQAMNDNARMQELKSQAALRRIQERAATQQMGFALQAHNMMVDEQAAMTKAMAQVQIESQPFLPAPPGTEDMGRMIGPDGSPMGQAGMVPNPAYTPLDQSLMKNVLPAVGKFRPQEVDNFVANVSMMPYRLAEAKRQEALALEAGSAGASGPGTVQQVTGDFEGAPKLNVFVPPKGRGSVQLVGSSGLETVTGNDGRTYERQKDGSLKPLAATPDQQNAGRTKQKILSEALKIDPAQVGLDGTITPEGWASVQKQSQITPATRTGLEKQMSEGGRIFALGNQLADLLSGATVGPIGNATRLYEGVMSALNPEFKIGPATDTATVATEFQSALVRGMKSDSNIAEPERKQLSNAMPDVTSWHKGVAPAKSTLATVLQQWGTLSRNNALIRGKPITREWMTPTEIVEEYAAGKITRTQADTLRDGNGWMLINKLRGEALR